MIKPQPRYKGKWKLIVSKDIKNWNKDQIPKFEEAEKQIFPNEMEAYKYVCWHFGSSLLYNQYGIIIAKVEKNV
jgi:hypothetical protein